MDIRILRFDSLPSTNTEAANQARQGAAEGLCVVADEQTGGKGRQGRSWVSTKGSGVYMSLVLRPKIEARYLPLITLMAAVAVYDLLKEGYRLDPDIKWPNDILVGGKKICGILAEAVETPAGVAVILGIGINLQTPVDQKNATSLTAESQHRADRDEIVEALLVDIAHVYAEFRSSPTGIVEMWTARSSYASGLDVEIALENGTFTGSTDGLEDNGALRVRLPDGSLRIIQAGDVQRLRTS